jgi:hypothetical protein
MTKSDEINVLDRYNHLRRVIAYSNMVKNKSIQMIKTRKEPELRKVIFQNNLLDSVESKIRQLYIH